MFRHARNLICSNQNSSLLSCGRLQHASGALMTGLLLASGAAAQVTSSTPAVPAKAAEGKLGATYST